MNPPCRSMRGRDRVALPGQLRGNWLEGGGLGLTGWATEGDHQQPLLLVSFTGPGENNQVNH